MVNVHLKGHFCLSRHAAAYWRDQVKAGNTVEARIVNTSSVTGVLGRGGTCAYSPAEAVRAEAARDVARMEATLRRLQLSPRSAQHRLHALKQMPLMMLASVIEKLRELADIDDAERQEQIKALEEVLIALRDDRHWLNDPDGLFRTGKTSGKSIVCDSDRGALASLYSDGFSAKRFVEVIESATVWNCFDENSVQ